MRLIDADALKEELAKEIKTNDMGLWLKILLVIDNAPTVKTYCYFCGQTEHGQIEEKPQGDWIPVSKELPNKNGWYICTCEGICNRTVGVVGYDAIQKKWGRGGVIAWQPLPEPYKKGDTE